MYAIITENKVSIYIATNFITFNTVCALIRGKGESVLYGSKYSKMKKVKTNCGAYRVHHNFYFYLFVCL